MRLIILALLAGFAGSAFAQSETLAYWAQNDNNLPGGGFGFQVGDFSQGADAGSLAEDAELRLGNFVETNTDGVYDCIQSFGGTTVNALDGFEGGGSLSPQGCADTANNGMYIELAVSTVGYQAPVISWAQRGTASGFDSRQFAWSDDGGDSFTGVGSDEGTLGSSWVLAEYDLAGIDSLADNPDVVFRITLDGASGATGNNRFDNIRIDAAPLGSEPGVEPLPYATDFSTDPFEAGWTDVNLDGNQVWDWSESFGNVSFSPFVGSCQVNENWLITPAFELPEEGEVVTSFDVARGFPGDNPLEVLYSTDYPGDGDLSDFSWELMRTIESDEFSSNNAPMTFGPFDDLAELEGTVHLAFRFQYDSGDCATWRVADFRIDIEDEAPSEFACVADPEDDDSVTRIHAIQGSGFSSPIGGGLVEVQAIVVGAFQDADNGEIGGFFLQEPDDRHDADPLSSEGIYISPVQSGIAIPEVAIGDEVRVAGRVRENFSQTEVFQVSAFELCDGDQLDRASPVVLQLPVDDLIELEAVEGMWVSLSQALMVTEVFNAARFAEFTVATDRLFQPTQVVAPGEAANDLQDLNDRSRLIIDQGLAGAYRTPYQPGLDGTPLNADNPIRVGYRIQLDFEGVMGFAFSNYRLFALQPAEFDEADSPRPEMPPELPEGNLRAGSFNVENLFTTLQDGSAACGPNELSCRGATSESELERQRDKLVSSIMALDADVLGLIEVENDDDDSTLQFLVDAINEAGPEDDWTFVATGYTGTDAIKNAFIYRSSRVSPVGDVAVLDSSVDVDPPFDDSRQRPILTQAFELVENGELFTMSVVHLRSKNCGSNASGDNEDQGDGQGCWNALRAESVESFRAWMDTDPSGSGTDRHLVVGDFNAYAQEDPLQVLVGEGYVNQAIRANEDDPAVYSYVFMGQSGSLDHVLASPAMNDRVLGAVNWAVNTDEIPAFAYPETLPASSLPKPEDFYQPDAFRSSDHDPLVISVLIEPVEDELFSDRFEQE